MDIRAYFVLLLSSFCFILHAPAKERVDIVSYSRYLLPNDSCPLEYKYIQNYNVAYHYDLNQYVRDFKADDPKLKKVIFFDYCEDPKLKKLPKKKLVCFKWEAIKIPLRFYEPYSRVYTFDDDLVDGKKFFKFYYPVLKDKIPDVVSFDRKKLCTMVVGNWIPERIKILTFFASKPEGEFEFYGSCPDGFANSHMYKGKIPGTYSSNEKLKVINKYRFCICFENTHTTPGYITEKIFDVFAAGSVPIYFGPKNVEKYIPKRCFIDYRDFKNNEQLYQYLKKMDRKTYSAYLRNIEEYLKSDQAHLFSPESFEFLLYEAVSR